MPERLYSVREIDALRLAIEHKWLFGTYGFYRGGSSRSYREEEKAKCVEELVRTHMMAGHTAEDLYASERVSEDDERRKAEGEL